MVGRLPPVGHPVGRVYQQRGYEKNRIDRSGGCRNKKAEMAARACRLRRESDEHILPARLPDLDSYTRKLECRIAALERQKASRTTWWSNAWNESHQLRRERGASPEGCGARRNSAWRSLLQECLTSRRAKLPRASIRRVLAVQAAKEEHKKSTFNKHSQK